MPEDLNNVSMDPTTGLVTYNGVIMTYRNLLNEWDSENSDLAYTLSELRDASSDIQALWGSKDNNFVDDWFYKIKPLRRQRGYPYDILGVTQI